MLTLIIFTYFTYFILRKKNVTDIYEEQLSVATPVNISFAFSDSLLISTQQQRAAFSQTVSVQIHFRHVSLQQKGYNIALRIICIPLLPTQFDNSCTCGCMHIHHCYTVTSAECLSLPSSRCNRVAKTNAFARISLRLPSLLFSFLPDFLKPRSSRLSVTVLSFSLFLASVHIQWRMKAFWGPNIFCVIS